MQQINGYLRIGGQSGRIVLKMSGEPIRRKNAYTKALQCYFVAFNFNFLLGGIMKTLSEQEKKVIDYLKNHFIDFSYTFVPFSMSRSREEKTKSFNYIVSLKRGKKVISTDYMKGRGHCEVKLYPDSSKPHISRINARKEQIINELCETGKKPAFYDVSKCNIFYPNACEVVYNLLSDSVCGVYRFDQFCCEFGYDDDSISAHKIWEACQKIAKDVESFFTMQELKELNELLEDY